jgi:hypothetical protein
LSEEAGRKGAEPDLIRATARILEKPPPAHRRLSRADRIAIQLVPICQICLIAIARAELRPELVIAAMVIAGLVPIVAFFWFETRRARKTKRH